MARSWNTIEVFRDGTGVVHARTSFRDLGPVDPALEGGVHLIVPITHVFIRPDDVETLLGDLEEIVSSTRKEG